jgi:hypothetical protein
MTTAWVGWARLAGVAGLVANALLVLFFVLGRPWQPEPTGFAWLGPANDAVLVVQFVALVPVAVAVHRVVGGRAAVVVATMIAVVVLQVLLLAGALPFAVEGPAVTGCLLVTFGWVLVVNRRPGLPGGVARFGRTVGLCFLTGMAVVAAGLALPWGSAGQLVVVGVGGFIGIVGWLGLPVWPLLLARQVFKEDT